jgi:hypothetical protein
MSVAIASRTEAFSEIETTLDVISSEAGLARKLFGRDFDMTAVMASSKSVWFRWNDQNGAGGTTDKFVGDTAE